MARKIPKPGKILPKEEERRNDWDNYQKAILETIQELQKGQEEIKWEVTVMKRSISELETKMEEWMSTSEERHAVLLDAIMELQNAQTGIKDKSKDK